MNQKFKVEMWYHNTTDKNITLAELDMSIKAHAYVDIFKYNPNLTLARVLKSQEDGILARYASKLIRVSGPPKKALTEVSRIALSKEPIYSKSHSVINIDPKEKYFVEQLEADFIEDGIIDENRQVAINEKFLKEVDLDGFSDPLEDLMK